MYIFRENMYKQATSRETAAMFMRTDLKDTTIVIHDLGIIVCRPKEGSP